MNTPVRERVAFEARWATAVDERRLGMLTLTGLAAAPSSEVGLEDVYDDPEELGEQLLAGSALVLLASCPSTGVALGGLRLVPREFIRASHVIEAAILVSPTHRRGGVARGLFDLAIETLIAEGRRSKVVVRAAADDQALIGLLETSPHGWMKERVEIGALWRSGRVVDMYLFGLLLECAAPSPG